MAFALVKINQGRINQPEPEYLTADATIKKGDALVFGTSTNAGKVVKPGTATTKPLFIAMADGVSGDVIPVCRITPEMLWETTFNHETSGTAFAHTIGEKASLYTDYATITNTAQNATGVATVVEVFGTAIGDTVYVRFE